MVSVRFPDFLFCDVFSDALEYLFGFAGAQDLKQVVTLLWTFKLPWNWAYNGTLFHPGVAQFAFGFYSVMLTSTVLGLITMVLYKPRSWCVYCPMGTMTQLICKVKDKKTDKTIAIGTYMPVAISQRFHYSLSPRSFSSSVMVTVPRDSLTMPSLWKYRSIRVMTSR